MVLSVVFSNGRSGAEEPVSMDKVNRPEETSHMSQTGEDNEDMQDLMARATDVIFPRVQLLRYLLGCQTKARSTTISCCAGLHTLEA